MPDLSHYRRAAAWATLSALCLVPRAATAQSAPPDPSSPLSLLPQDLSPLGMFLAADVVVKSVMIGLLVASVVTWTVLIVKLAELWLARRRLVRADAVVRTAASLADARQSLQDRFGLASHMLEAVRVEARRSDRQPDPAGVKERAASHLADIVNSSVRQMSAGTGVLATIGSTAPFVGLFGTVWGIMNAFIGISEAQTTNLAVVAPGIAEALLATALGLVAAIPAVVIYNMFARAIALYRHRLAGLSAAIQRHLSYELEALPLREAA